MARVADRCLKRGSCAAWLVVLLALLASAALAAATERASTWREHEIRIDGQDDDWRGLTMPVKGYKFSLGIVNDGEFLYLCLPTKDSGTRAQITRLGLVVWLDKAGGKRENFGIHFPVALGRAAKATAPQPPGAEEGHDRQEGPERPPPGPPVVVGILGRGGRDAKIVPLDQAGGIEAQLGIHDDLLVYELRVPLTRTDDHPFAPDLSPGDSLRLTIETASYRGPVAPLGVPGGGLIVGEGGGGVGVGIGVGGGGGLHGFQNPLRLQMNVRLATGPSR